MMEQFPIPPKLVGNRMPAPGLFPQVSMQMDRQLVPTPPFATDMYTSVNGSQVSTFQSVVYMGQQTNRLHGPTSHTTSLQHPRFNQMTGPTLPTSVPDTCNIDATPLDPNIAAHMDAVDKNTESTQRLLEQLTVQCSQTVRKEELTEVLWGFENYNHAQKRGPNVQLPSFSDDATASFESWARELEENFVLPQLG